MFSPEEICPTCFQDTQSLHPQLLLPFCSSQAKKKKKYPEPEFKFNIHLRGMETFHPHASEDLTVYKRLMNSMLCSSACLIHKEKTPWPTEQRWFQPGKVSNMLHRAGKIRQSMENTVRSSTSDSPETLKLSAEGVSYGGQVCTNLSDLLSESFR